MGRLQFIEDGHLYLLDGMPVASNTQILTEAGLIDTAFCTPDGRDRGTRVHSGVWFADEGFSDWGDAVQEDERGYVQGFLRFKTEVDWKTDFNELAVWALPGFGTRLDLLGHGMFQVNGVFARRRAVIDIKSGPARKWVDLQTAGHALAVSERIMAQDEAWATQLEYIGGHPHPELRFALELRRDGSYRLKQFENPHAQDEFRGFVHAYRWKERNGYLKAA